MAAPVASLVPRRAARRVSRAAPRRLSLVRHHQQIHGTASAVLLDHERLDLYAVAVALDQLVVAMTKRSGRGQAWLWDQAQRASGSVVLNVAESCGREGADRAHCLRIARGSGLEVDAALTLLAHRGACIAAQRAQARELTVRVVSMLTRLMAASVR